MLTEKRAITQTKMFKASMNAFYRTDHFCRKSERNAKLTVKRIQLHQVKKSFGLDYMNLLEKEASAEKLDECLRDGHMKIGLLNKSIHTLRAEKASLDERLKERLTGNTSWPKTKNQKEENDIPTQFFDNSDDSPKANDEHPTSDSRVAGEGTIVIFPSKSESNEEDIVVV